MIINAQENVNSAFVTNDNTESINNFTDTTKLILNGNMPLTNDYFASIAYSAFPCAKL